MFGDPIIFDKSPEIVSVFSFHIFPLFSPTGGNKALKQVVSDLLDALVRALLSYPMP